MNVKVYSSIIVIAAWYSILVHRIISTERIRKEGLFRQGNTKYRVLYLKSYPWRRFTFIVIWISFSFFFIKYWYGIASGILLSSLMASDSILITKEVKRERERLAVLESSPEINEDPS